MNIAVCLSGTMRFHYKSLKVIQRLRVHHKVNVYIHTWKNVEDTIGNSWSHYVPTEPTDQLVYEYEPTSVKYDDWPTLRELFVEQVESWRKDCGLTTFTHYGMVGMWYSIHQSYIGVDPEKYDLILRLRFDCGFDNDPTMFHGPSWVIPEAVDFGGLNDQLGWFWINYYRPGITRETLDAYFGVYPKIGSLISQGVEYSPEHLLKKSFDNVGIVPTRPLFKYTIHDD